MTDTTSELEHHEATTDPARRGYSADPTEVEAGDETHIDQAALDSRLGTCPECDGQFADVKHHAAIEHPGLNMGLPTDPDELRRMADAIEAARAIDGVRAEQNTAGGIDYSVDVDDTLTGSDEVR